MASTATAVGETPTEAYEKRFGLGPNNIDGFGGFVRDVGVRALGAASDLGDAMTLGAAGKYLYADKQPGAMPAAAPANAATMLTAAPVDSASTNLKPGLTNNLGTMPAATVQAAPAARSVALPDGVYQHGRGQYSDQSSGMGFPAGFTGQPNAQNQRAAASLAAMNSPILAEQQGGVPAFTAPAVAHSGNDWSSRQRLKDMETSASSITNTERWGGRGASHSPAVQRFVDASRADLAAQGKAPDMQLKTNEVNAGLQRAAMAEAGADRRAQGQLSLGMGQLALGAQRNSIDAQRASSDERLRAPQIRAAERMGQMQETLLNAKTPEEQAAIAAQIRAYSGKDEADWKVQVTPATKNVDGSTSAGSIIRWNTRNGDVQEVGGVGGSSQSLPPGMTKQVGTAGGKPVYEDAKGNRFMGG
ncbi:MAG: hypothetical protein RR574_16065 [Comamonas sp.]